MKTPVRNRWFGLTAALLLATLASGVLEGFLPHTDDGCAVEIHCLACRSQIGSAAVVTLVAQLTVRPHVLDPILVPEEDAGGRTPIPHTPSRAPPLA